MRKVSLKMCFAYANAIAIAIAIAIDNANAYIKLTEAFFMKKAIFFVSTATLHVGDYQNWNRKFGRKSGQNKMINHNFCLL